MTGPRTFSSALRCFALAAILVCAGSPSVSFGQELISPATPEAVRDLRDRAAKERSQAEGQEARARGFRELAHDARGKIVSADDPADIQYWLDRANDYGQSANRLEEEVRRLRADVDAKEAHASHLEQQIQAAAPNDSPSRGPAQQEPACPSCASDMATHRGKPASRITLGEVLGAWRNAEEHAPRPFVIVQEDPDNPAYPYRLEAHTPDRVWKGNYTSFDAGDPARPQNARVVFRYKPKPEEMSQSIPEWARQAVAGELEWRIELDEKGTCGSPRLKGRWFPGEVKWDTGPDGVGINARVSGDGKAREFELEPSDDLYGDVFAAPRLFVQLPGEHEPLDEPMEGLIKLQHFFVRVALPPDMAEKQGEKLQVTIRGLTSGDTYELELTRGGMRRFHSVVYSHDDPITIADSLDAKGSDRDPPFLSWNYIMRNSGSRIDLEVENGEIVEFRFGDAVESFPVYNSWVQRGLVRFAAARERLRAVYTGQLQSPNLSAAEKQAAATKLQMIRNLDAFLATKGPGRWEGPYDLILYSVAENYLHHSEGLVVMSAEEISNKAAAIKVLSHSKGAELYLPLSDEERDGRNHLSGLFNGLVWTSRYEMNTTYNAVLSARDDAKKELPEIYRGFALGMYTAVMAGTGVGDAYTLFAGKDIFGKPVPMWQRAMAAVGLASSNLLQVGLPVVMSQRLAASAGREARLGRSARLKEDRLVNSGRSIELPRTLSAAQRARVESRLTGSEGQGAEKPVTCIRGVRSEAGLPGPMPDVPPHPPGFDVDTLGVKDAYGSQAELVNPGAPPLREPQRFGTCQCSAVARRVHQATDLDLDEISIFKIGRNNGLFTDSENPLRYGYSEAAVRKFLELMGAEVIQTQSGRRLNLDQLARWQAKGWHIKDVIQANNSSSWHAVDIEGFSRNAAGEIESVTFFDPAFGKLVRVPACDYVRMAQLHPNLLYRWSGAKSASIARPQIQPPPRIMGNPQGLDTQTNPGAQRQARAELPTDADPVGDASRVRPLDELRRTIPPEERLRWDEAEAVIDRLIQANPRLRELDRNQISMYAGVHAGRPGTPEKLAAEALNYNGGRITPDELARATGLNAAQAEHALRQGWQALQIANVDVHAPPPLTRRSTRQNAGPDRPIRGLEPARQSTATGTGNRGQQASQVLDKLDIPGLDRAKADAYIAAQAGREMSDAQLAPAQLAAEAIQNQGLRVTSKELVDAAGLPDQLKGNAALRAAMSRTRQNPPTPARDPGRSDATRTALQQDSAPSAETARQPPPRVRLDNALAAYYRARGEPQPPMHTTTREALEQIRQSRILEAPSSGASWSYRGVLRDGDIAIRLKPGSERFVTLTPTRDAFGQVPHYHPQGSGRGPRRTYVPIEHLEYFDVAGGRWVPIE